MIDISLDLVFASILYLVLLLVTGTFARRARRGATFNDFFLAGRSFGLGLLVFTLFATQYSGNAFSGIPGETYREGLAIFMSVTFGVAIAFGFILFVPTLYRLSRERQFVTPTDYLQDRFGSRALNYISAAIFAITLLNFLLAQLMALGQAFDALTAGQIPYGLAVVVGGLVVLLYTVAGGMRAVAWTDVFQGILMIVGLLVVVVLLLVEVGPPASVVRTVNLLRPELVATPTLSLCFVWLSNVVLLGLGAPLYPQAIQRIYAARRSGGLRVAIATMAVAPLIVTTTALFIGASGIALLPQLDRMTADQVTFLVIRYLVESNAFAYYPALIAMVAIMAAIMSTADSCLLSLTSIVARDVVQRGGEKRLEGRAFTRLVTLVAVVIMIITVAVAIRPRMTLWGLLIVKFEVLIQLSPAFVLGMLHTKHHPRAFTVGDVLPGIVTGLVVTIGLYLGNWESLYGFHAGAVGVALNYLLVWVRRGIRVGWGRRRIRNDRGELAA